MTPDECVRCYEETGTTQYYGYFPFAKNTKEAKIVVNEFGDYWFETNFADPEDIEWFPY